MSVQHPKGPTQRARQCLPDTGRRCRRHLSQNSRDFMSSRCNWPFLFSSWTSGLYTFGLFYRMCFLQWQPKVGHPPCFLAGFLGRQEDQGTHNFQSQRRHAIHVPPMRRHPCQSPYGTAMRTRREHGEHACERSGEIEAPPPDPHSKKQGPCATRTGKRCTAAVN